jgi:hypothetical protein
MTLRIDAVFSLVPVARIVIPAVVALLFVGNAALAGESALSGETPPPVFQAEPMRPVESRPYRPAVEPPRIVEEIPGAPLEARPASAEEADIPVQSLDLPAPSASAVSMAAEAPGRPLQIGFNRRVADFLEPSVAKSRVLAVAEPCPAASEPLVCRSLLPARRPCEWACSGWRGCRRMRNCASYSDQAGQEAALIGYGAKDVLQIVERNRGAGPQTGERCQISIGRPRWRVMGPSWKFASGIASRFE